MSKTHGIILFGANGSGKTTLGRELARVLGFRAMDIEDYHFAPSQIPYTVFRPREEVCSRMLFDIREHGSFVLSAVTGDFGPEMEALYTLAVYSKAPRDLCLQRIEKRAYEHHGERVCKGGDMYENNRRFIEFAATRDLSKIDRWAETLTCPILHIDGTKSCHENAAMIAAHVQLADKVSKPASTCKIRIPCREDLGPCGKLSSANATESTPFGGKAPNTELKMKELRPFHAPRALA